MNRSASDTPDGSPGPSESVVALFGLSRGRSFMTMWIANVRICVRLHGSGRRDVERRPLADIGRGRSDHELIAARIDDGALGHCVVVSKIVDCEIDRDVRRLSGVERHS